MHSIDFQDVQELRKDEKDLVGSSYKYLIVCYNLRIACASPCKK